MSDLPEKIRSLQKRVGDLNQQKHQISGKIETLELRKQEMEKESQSKFGVSPADLPSLITSKVVELDALLSSLDSRTKEAESLLSKLGG